jgi:hypothetical protein
MTLATHFTNNIEEIGEVAWNALSAGRMFQSYNWYRFGEKVMANAKPTYVTLSENGHAMARASFWRVDNEPITAGFAPGLMEAFFRRWPLLICRSPLSYMTGLIIPDSARTDLLDKLIRIGRHLRHRERCSLLLLDGLAAATAHAIPWSLAYSFEMPGTLMEIRGLDNLDQYLASRSYRVRKDLRRHLRKIEECNLLVTRHQTVPDPPDLDKAVELYHTLEARKGAANTGSNPWVRAMLQNLEGANGTWLAARLEGRLVGWAATFEDCGVQFGTAIGLDNVAYAYFALLFEALRLGLERRLHSLYWGPGSYSFKKRLGFRTIDNDSVAATF